MRLICIAVLKKEFVRPLVLLRWCTINSTSTSAQSPFPQSSNIMVELTTTCKLNMRTSPVILLAEGLFDILRNGLAQNRTRKRYRIYSQLLATLKRPAAQSSTA